ncbi:nuclear transport factor 2 family protein [Novosphingobium pentaromativorans]|uniref:SnoaL-like domain-containing protein n=1 Tax=Novosphingobium pentaromativorans US6-1 TaxID=1088721 RepID=G6EGF5_9SPHN|nr:nuclear transport factor 2 family protein [Novosphingobium pentaromativorans]EHJ59606.1 hypothetical protein NSU_3489 [Novosphingobium pentaromativorans US6-1]
MQQNESLASVEARISICETLSAWADCLDRNEYDRLAEVWDEDCVWSTFESQEDHDMDRPAMRGANRRESILKLGKLLSRIGQTHHLIANQRISLDGDTARVECLVRTFHAPKPDGPQGFWESLSRMYVTLARKDRWRITRQDYVVLIGLGSMDIFRKNTPRT